MKASTVAIQTAETSDTTGSTEITLSKALTSFETEEAENYHIATSSVYINNTFTASSLATPKSSTHRWSYGYRFECKFY